MHWLIKSSCRLGPVMLPSSSCHLDTPGHGAHTQMSCCPPRAASGPWEAARTWNLKSRSVVVAEQTRLQGRVCFLLSSGAAERLLPLKIQGFVPHGCAAAGRAGFTHTVAGSALVCWRALSPGCSESPAPPSPAFLLPGHRFCKRLSHGPVPKEDASATGGKISCLPPTPVLSPKIPP